MAAPELVEEDALALLEHVASSDLVSIARNRLVSQARERVVGAYSAAVETHARARAEELSRDHARVRAALSGVSRVTVEPVRPVDVIGIFVLVPAGI